VTDADYGKLISERPHLLRSAFTTSEVPVKTFTVRRMLNEAIVPELEKMLTYDEIGTRVLEEFAGSEIPSHMAANFQAAVNSHIGAAAGA
jgi:hypothetical protein